MYHVVQLLNEAIETEDVSLLNIDPKEESYTKEKDDELWQEAYTMASVKLKESYDTHAALYREAIQNTRESINKNHAVVHNEKRPPVKVSLHMITVSPQIDCNVFRLVDKFFEDTNLDGYKSSDGVVGEFIGKICSDAGCNQISKDMFTGPIILANICDDIIIDNVHMLATRVSAAADELYHIYEFLAKKIRDDRNVAHLEAYVRVFDVCAKVISAKISAYGVSLLEILQVANMKPADRNILMEAVEYSEEDAKKYLNEIDNLIDEIRAFYDDFKYKEIITPRKKKQEKMMQYVLGALQRKYTLKIPIYKVSGVTDEVKDIVEHKFIDKLESITKKYPNFVIMSPSWDDDTDMFIYITLREPFGEKEDRKDREQQAQNEAIDINDQISALQKQIDHNEKAQSVYEAKNGKSDEKLLKEHDKMCDDMEALCKKRRESNNESISLTEGIDKDAMTGLIGLGALIALGTGLTISAIKEKIKDNKKAKKMTMLSEMIHYYDQVFSSSKKYISSAKFIKCKKNTLKFIDDCTKLLDNTYKNYSRYTNEFLTFDKYYENHSVKESKNHLLEIVSNAKNVYKTFNEDLNKLYKNISSDTEFIECDSSEILSKFNKLEKYAKVTEYESVYEKFYLPLDSERGPKGFDHSLANAIATSNPDEDKIMIMFWDEAAILDEAIRKIANLIKVQMKGKSLNESVSDHSETLVEASLTKEEKNNLKDWEFGLPDKRKYPLNDYTRIKKAIEFFGYCDAEDKKTLADNIVRRVIELNLVGSITVSDKHPNKDYFPEWMRYHKDDVSLTINGNKYTITLKGEKVDWGTLPNHDESESDIQVTNESGQLF